MTTRYYVVLGTDGYRAVVWGLGAGSTSEEARDAAMADAREWGSGQAGTFDETVETTREVCQRVLEGEIDARVLGLTE